MLKALASLAILAVIAYAIVSFQSALRMYFRHRDYVHLEFSPERVRGQWGRGRLGLLRRLRWLALAAVVVLLLCAVVAVLQS